MTTDQSPRDAIGSGGPLDGHRLGTAEADEFQVEMADGTRHRYTRTDVVIAAGQVYEHSGRM